MAMHARHMLAVDGQHSNPRHLLSLIRRVSFLRRAANFCLLAAEARFKLCTIPSFSRTTSNKARGSVWSVNSIYSSRQCEI